MKKNPDLSLIKNELESGSAFFSGGKKDNNRTVEPSPSSQSERVEVPSGPTTLVHSPTSDKTEEHRTTRTVTEDLRTSSPPSDEVIEMIRKAVKQVGREGQVFRLSLEEKRELADIVYTYKREGVRTSENEVCRIAIIYLLHDYKKQGNQSVLARVIDALIS